MNDIRFYIPNPTKTDKGLSEAKIGTLVIVYDKNNKRQKYVVCGTMRQHNNKNWGLHLTPRKNWTKEVIVY